VKYGGWWFDPIVKRAAHVFARQPVSVDDMAQEAYMALLRGMRRAYDMDKPTRSDFALAKTVVWNRLRRAVGRRRGITIDPAIVDTLSPGDLAHLPAVHVPPAGTANGQIVRAVLRLDGCESQREAASRLGVTGVAVHRAVRDWREAAL